MKFCLFCSSLLKNIQIHMMIYNGLDSTFQIESPICLSILLCILIWYKYEVFVINSGNGKFALLVYGFQSGSVFFVIQSHWFVPYLKLLHLQKEQLINNSQSLPKTLFFLLVKTQDIQDDASESRKNNSPLKTINRFPFFKKHTRLCFLVWLKFILKILNHTCKFQSRLC